MRKLIVLFALLFTLPMFGDDNQQQPVTAEQYGSVRSADPIDEWMYWQEHSDVLERAAKFDEGRPKHRGIAAEIEGCKYCQKMELYSPVYCINYQPPGGENFITQCSANWIHCAGQYGCDEWTSWVPKEVGNKCVTIGGTMSLSAVLTADHGVSNSMEQWLMQRWSLSPEQIASGFSPYTWSIDGGSSCSGASSATQTWTTQVGGGYSWSHQVKIWSCAGVSGSACSEDSQIQP